MPTAVVDKKKEHGKRQMEPINWDYELDRGLTDGEEHPCQNELNHAASKWCGCAVGELLFDMDILPDKPSSIYLADGFQADQIEKLFGHTVYQAGVDFAVIIEKMMWSRARELRTLIRLGQPIE